MKSIFIDCNNQLAPVFARARNADDPPIAVNTDAFQSADLPRLLAGYHICLDDHSYMPTEVMAECRQLKHIVFLGTGFVLRLLLLVQVSFFLFGLFESCDALLDR